MTVYVDSLLVLNLYISFFLLLTTEKLLSKQVKFSRRLFSSVISSLFSLYIFLPEISPVISALVRLAMSSAVVIINFGFKSFKTALKALFIFWVSNFMFAGIMYAVWQIWTPRNLAINNSFVYINLSPLMLIILTVVCYLLISFYRKITDKMKPQSLYREITLIYKDRAVTLTSLVDSGNLLQDIFTDRPVIVISFDSARRLLPEEVCPYFESVETPPPNVEGYRVVPYQGIGVKGLLPAFACFCQCQEERIKVVVAVNSSNLSDDYDAIIGLGLIKYLGE